jgi:hypothetical protein
MLMTFPQRPGFDPRQLAAEQMSLAANAELLLDHSKTTKEQAARSFVEAGDDSFARNQAGFDFFYATITEINVGMASMALEAEVEHLFGSNS